MMSGMKFIAIEALAPPAPARLVRAGSVPMPGT